MKSFILCLIGIACLVYLGSKGAAVSTEIVGVISTYILGTAGMKAAFVHSSGKDPTCDTLEAIKTVKD